MSIQENILELKNLIEQKKKSLSIKNNITLIAVSKNFGADKIIEALNAGIYDFGENRINEAIPKIEQINDKRIKWHFIGHLQSNKASKAVRYFDVIHSIDSINLAEKVNSFANQYKKVMPIFIQVNTSFEDTKSGIYPEELENLISFVINKCNFLELQGLMTIGPLTSNENNIRKCFKDLKILKQKMSNKYGEKYFPFLSMGMSGDWQIALEEGATHLRIGTAIFGIRN